MIETSGIRGGGLARGGELVRQVDVSHLHAGGGLGRCETLNQGGISDGRLAAARMDAGNRQDAIAATMDANHERGMDAPSIPLHQVEGPRPMHRRSDTSSPFPGQPGRSPSARALTRRGVLCFPARPP